VNSRGAVADVTAFLNSKEIDIIFLRYTFLSEFLPVFFPLPVVYGKQRQNCPKYDEKVT